MSPNPTTPTPRRFLLPKRASQSRGGSFQSTPRFGAPSSVPRPTPLRSQALEDVDDDEDEERIEASSVEGEEEENEQLGGRGDVAGDAIEVGSETSLGWDDRSEREGSEGRGGEDMGDEMAPETPVGREVKRRKLSISPLPASGSPPPSRPGYTGDQDDDDQDGLAFSPVSSQMDHEQPHDAEDKLKAQAQPTFRAPPRFKQLDADPAVEGLPAAFSPQRRGAKYLTGGLAAELQGWLSEVKGEDDMAGSTMQVTVEDIRPGRRMYLMEGKFEGEDETKSIILAGEGRLTGLGRMAVVDVGSLVEIGQPVWDVKIKERTWMVACDWAVP